MNSSNIVIPVICLFGFFTNLINLTVLLSSKMKDVSFKYVLAISLSDLIYLTLEGYKFIVSCSDDCSPLINITYLTQLYDYTIFHYICSSLAIFCIFIDIFLSLIRYSILKNKTYLQSISCYKIIGFFIFISFHYYSPLLFYNPIQKNNNNNITPIILQSIRIILAMFVLTSINIINVFEFRKRYSNREKNKRNTSLISECKYFFKYY